MGCLSQIYGLLVSSIQPVGPKSLSRWAAFLKHSASQPQKPMWMGCRRQVFSQSAPKANVDGLFFQVFSQSAFKAHVDGLLVSSILPIDSESLCRWAVCLKYSASQPQKRMWMGVWSQVFSQFAPKAYVDGLLVPSIQPVSPKAYVDGLLVTSIQPQKLVWAARLEYSANQPQKLM